MTRRALAVGLLLAAAVGLTLRLPQLDRRPLHNDECVNALKLQELWERGQYRYDPVEFHGPTLYYFSLPFLWLSGARSFEQLNDRVLRWAPVAFGAGLIGLLWLLRTGLGPTATLAAALLTALSPAMVFYSRYLIHEIWLVFFTLLLVGAGWRYCQTGKLAWAILAGAAMGLMYATKETFVLAVAALGAALLLTAGWTRWRDRIWPVGRPSGTSCSASRLERRGERADWIASSRGRPLHWMAAAGTGLVVAGLFFSSLFTHPRGLVDAVRTYALWFERAGGQEGHRHPWHFYLERLFWFQRPRGPVWTEGAILALALVGGAAALGRRAGSDLPPTECCPASPDSSHARSAAAPDGTAAGYSLRLARFLTFYALGLTAIYSVIPYKTPWCALGFLQPLILLAGIGAAELISLLRQRWWPWTIGAILLAAAAHLGWQAWRASFPMAADRRNPYVYAQTVPNLLELADKVKAIAMAGPEGPNTLVKVAAEDSRYLPLPWYLRQLKRVWWTDSPAPPYAPIMVVSASFRTNLDEVTNKRWLMVGLYEMRPAVFFELYVEFELWKRYLASRPPPKEE